MFSTAGRHPGIPKKGKMNGHVVNDPEERDKERWRRTGRIVLRPTTQARPMSTAAARRFAIPVESRGVICFDPAAHCAREER